jgi:hypothetical protein
MAGAKEVFDIVVIGAFLIGIVDDHGDRGSGADPFEEAAEYFYLVLLFAPGGVDVLARFTAVEFTLDKGFIDWQARRDAVDDTADGFAVGLTERTDAESLSESVHVVSL